MPTARLGGFVFAAVFVSSAYAAHAQQPKLFKINPNDPLDKKAVLALRRGLGAAELQTTGVRLATTDECNAYYMGDLLFVAGKPILGFPQWAVDAVMAHEVGHLVYRHVENKTALHQGLAEALQGLGMLLDRQHPEEGARVGGVIGQTVAALFIPKFTQGQEMQADAYAVQLLRAEGYRRPGEAVARALALLEEAVGPNRGGFFDTHPSFENRITRVRQADASPPITTPAAPTNATPPVDTSRFGRGSSAADVLGVQGQPDKRTHAPSGDMFFYGEAWVMFDRSGHVSGWYDPRHVLNVRQ